MPIPVYMLCSESLSVDSITGLLSHYRVFNSLQITPLGTKGPTVLPPSATPWFQMTASATWMLEAGERVYDKYEYQFLIRQPKDGPELIVGSGFFTFAKLFHRIDLNVQGQPLSQSGTFHIENRIRKTGASTWIKQSYPLVVEVVGQIRSDATDDKPPSAESKS